MCKSSVPDDCSSFIHSFIPFHKASTGPGTGWASGLWRSVRCSRCSTHCGSHYSHPQLLSTASTCEVLPASFLWLLCVMGWQCWESTCDRWEMVNKYFSYLMHHVGPLWCMPDTISQSPQGFELWWPTVETCPSVHPSYLSVSVLFPYPPMGASWDCHLHQLHALKF